MYSTAQSHRGQKSQIGCDMYDLCVRMRFVVKKKIENRQTDPLRIQKKPEYSMVL